jgi:hypothetical protein
VDLWTWRNQTAPQFHTLMNLKTLLRSCIHFFSLKIIHVILFFPSFLGVEARERRHSTTCKLLSCSNDTFFPLTSFWVVFS